MLESQQKRNKRHKRTRSKISGTEERPRLCVFKSANHIYAQIVNDEKSKTILSAKDTEVKAGKSDSSRKIKLANEVGKLIAKKAIEKKIDKVVFDRGGYKYHGRVKSLAEGARQGGLKF